MQIKGGDSLTLSNAPLDPTLRWERDRGLSQMSQRRWPGWDVWRAQTSGNPPCYVLRGPEGREVFLASGYKRVREALMWGRGPALEPPPA